MKQYDILVILDPTAAADHLEAIRERLEALITNEGGEIKSMEHGGLRKLAYPIANQTNGAFLLFKVELDPARTGTLKTKISLDKEVLRVLLNQGGYLSFQERVIPRNAPRPQVTEVKIETPRQAATESKGSAPSAIQLEELEKKVEEILEQPKI